MTGSKPYILWLPSWYPNRIDPFIGDFVQRHAVATAAFVPLVVVHFVQAGPEMAIDANRVDISKTGGLEEHVVYFRNRPWGIKPLDKLRYHLLFYRHSRQYLKQLFRKNGLPAGVHVHVPMKAGNLALWIQTKYGVPFLLSEHSTAYVPVVPDHFYNRSRRYQQQVRRIFREALVVTNVSGWLGRVLSDVFDRREVQVVRNVVDTGLFHLPLAAPSRDPFVFIHASTLGEMKNIQGMLETFALLKQNVSGWKLVLVGPAHERLQAQVAALGLSEEVRLTGELPYQGVAKEMQQAHAFVLFSKMENFPCVVIEALCCGLPVVAGDVAGVPEAVDASNGLLVPTGDKDALLAALIAVKRDYGRFNRAEIAAAAAARYAYPVVGQQIFNLYRSILNIGR